jgi:NAD(P)-dependent dehydrogenase (short-subunit alcohol dehydrogenase family)
MEQLRFDGRVVVVTGAGRGIGRTFALLLAERGAKVVVNDLGCDMEGEGSSPDPADQVVAEIVAGGGEAVPSYGSVADEEGAASIIATALETWGRIDALVNNAGIWHRGRFETLTVDQFRRMMEAHFFGTLLPTMAAWPHFVEAGYGRIVNSASESMYGASSMSSYASAKGAVYALTRNLADEGEALGIKVNALATRAMSRTTGAGALRAASDEERAEAERWMAPELNAPAAAYLCHPDCAVNGEVLRSGMHSVARIAALQTKGFAKESLTVEDVADNLEAILDVTDADVPDCHALSRHIS